MTMTKIYEENGKNRKSTFLDECILWKNKI